MAVYVRLSIDVAPEQRRRLRVAAARADASLRDYVWQAVEARLLVDESVGPAAIEGASDPVLNSLWNNPADAIYDRL